MTTQAQEILDVAIQLTFSRRYRHDFWGALGESLIRTYQDYIRWIHCEGWNGVRIFGMQIPELEQKEYSLTLSIFTAEFKYAFGLDENVDDVKSELKNTFNYINGCFLDKGNPYGLFALDWFWHLKLLSKGLITSLRKALIQSENNVEQIEITINNVIDRFTRKQAIGSTSEVISDSISDIIVEIASAYWDAYGSDNSLSDFLKPYLKGKFLYLKSIEYYRRSENRPKWAV